MKILTIDFDIIMEPTINLYNSLTDYKVEYSQRFRDFNFMEYPQANFEIYTKIARLLHQLSCPVYFIDAHEEVYSFLVMNHYNDVEVINIDHHHDISYEESTFIENQPIACGNWVGRGIVEGKITKYTWVRNEYSEMPTQMICNQLNGVYQQTTISDDNYLKNNLKDIDYVIICKSAPWVPDQYMPLLDLWKKF